MSKYHSTVSRREFLKTLGLGGWASAPQPWPRRRCETSMR